MKFKSMARVSTELSSPIRISFQKKKVLSRVANLQHLPSFPVSKWSSYNFTLLICSDDELNRIRTISLQILRYSCSKHIFTFDKIELKWFFDSKKASGPRTWNIQHVQHENLILKRKKRWRKIDRVRIQLHARVCSKFGKDAKKLPGFESTKPYDSGVNPAWIDEWMMMLGLSLPISPMHSLVKS